jgi:DNA invertase Pin-like site-specific DNA recombinase
VRRGWQRLLSDLDAGSLDVVVTWEPSRADRDLETWVQFVAKCRTHGVLVHITGEDDTLDPRNASHWRRLIEGGVDAAMESEKISKRVLRGVASAAVAGGFHGDCPYGYVRVIVGERQTKHGPKPVKEQRPHPEHAPVVEEIITRIGHQDPINAIVADLDARGIVAPAGEKWNRNTVRKLALNVAYLGQRSHKGQVYDGCWPPLVSAEVFEAARVVLTAPRRKFDHPGRLLRLLSYLAVAPCGAQVHYMPAGNSQHKRHARYHCHGRDGCVAVGAAEVDEFITRLVVARCCEPDLREALTAADDDTAAQRARDEAAAWQRKLDDARASFLKIDGSGISAESLARSEAEIGPKLADAQRRSVSAKVPLALMKLLEAGRFGQTAVRPVWDGLSVPARRDVLKLIFRHITIGKPVHRIGRWSTDEDRLQAAAARVSTEWRTPGDRTGLDPAPKTRPGGARAQRRRQAHVDLAQTHEPAPAA